MKATSSPHLIIQVRTILGAVSLFMGGFGVTYALFYMTAQDPIRYVLSHARLICGLSGVLCVLLGLGLVRDRYHFTPAGHD